MIARIAAYLSPYVIKFHARGNGPGSKFMPVAMLLDVAMHPNISRSGELVKPFHNIAMDWKVTKQFT